MKKLTLIQRNKAAAKARIAAGFIIAQTAAMANKCPTCGGPIRHNLALRGWIQCAQFGAEGFRLDSSRPACDWQGFTE